ncbi:hypothetical protein ACC684_38775, partial [Rhizobium ruizarguesonis]
MARQKSLVVLAAQLAGNTGYKDYVATHVKKSIDIHDCHLVSMQAEYPDNFMFCSADVNKKASLEQALQDVT